MRHLEKLATPHATGGICFVFRQKNPANNSERIRRHVSIPLAHSVIRVEQPIGFRSLPFSAKTQGEKAAFSNKTATISDPF